MVADLFVKGIWCSVRVVPDSEVIGDEDFLRVLCKRLSVSRVSVGSKVSRVSYLLV